MQIYKIEEKVLTKIKQVSKMQDKDGYLLT